MKLWFVPRSIHPGLFNDETVDWDVLGDNCCVISRAYDGASRLYPESVSKCSQRTGLPWALFISPILVLHRGHVSEARRLGLLNKDMGIREMMGEEHRAGWTLLANPLLLLSRIPTPTTTVPVSGLVSEK